MPFDVIDESEKKQIKLEPLEHYAFFRNPHLSRNEQCIMKPFVPVSKDEYEENGKTYDKYMKHINCDLHELYIHLVYPNYNS